jgi:hypothetical protein
MKALKTIFSSFVIALLMTTSLNVFAAEKAIKAPEAVEAAVAKTQAALDALTSGQPAEEVSKLIKAASEATSEIYSNYKAEKVRDTVMLKLKTIRKQVIAGEKPEAEEGLKKAVDDLNGMKSII